jgi:hypothetical protein
MMLISVLVLAIVILVYLAITYPEKTLEFVYWIKLPWMPKDVNDCDFYCRELSKMVDDYSKSSASEKFQEIKDNEKEKERKFHEEFQNKQFMLNGIGNGSIVPACESDQYCPISS